MILNHSLMPHVGTLALLLFSAASAAETLHFNAYLAALEQHSPQLQSAAHEVISAEAEIGIAKLRPDPELTLSRERERIRTGEPRPSTRGLELSWELETGGKRRARISSAQTGVQLARAEQEATRLEILQEAAEGFIAACHDQLALERKRQTLIAFERIESANAVRHKAGDIGGMEWRQSRLERDRFAAEVREAQAEAQSSQLALMLPLGRTLEDVFGQGEDEMSLACDFLQHATAITIPTLPDLLGNLAQHNSLRAAQAALAHAQDEAKLTRAERWVNPVLSIGTERIRAAPDGFDFAGDAFDAAPPSRTLMVSLSVPLPLSRRNRGDLIQAESAVTQAMLDVQYTRINLQAEIRAAYARYQSAQETAAQYQSGMLEDAQQISAGMQVSYQNGAASLLELLSAQHDLDEAMLEALAAQAELARAAVQLQVSSGQRPAL